MHRRSNVNEKNFSVKPLAFRSTNDPPCYRVNYNLVPLRQVVSEVEWLWEPISWEEHISVCHRRRVAGRMLRGLGWRWDGIYPPKQIMKTKKTLNKINNAIAKKSQTVCKRVEREIASWNKLKKGFFIYKFFAVLFCWWSLRIPFCRNFDFPFSSL